MSHTPVPAPAKKEEDDDGDDGDDAPVEAEEPTKKAEVTDAELNSLYSVKCGTGRCTDESHVCRVKVFVQKKSDAGETAWSERGVGLLSIQVRSCSVPLISICIRIIPGQMSCVAEGGRQGQACHSQRICRPVPPRRMSCNISFNDSSYLLNIFLSPALSTAPQACDAMNTSGIADRCQAKSIIMTCVPNPPVEPKCVVCGVCRCLRGSQLLMG